MTKPLMIERISRLAAAAAAIALLAGCGASGPAPAPRRPEAPAEVAEDDPAPADCAPAAGDVPPVAYAERSIDEAKNLANSGAARMEASRDRAEPLEAREAAIAEAVDHFLTALAADPYNVQATYELAAAYAQIGRRQCALNLLARLAPLKSLRSVEDEVREAVDRLLGRQAYQGRMDPRFFELRDDPGFRELVTAL